MLLGCDVHRAATLQTRVYDFTFTRISGMISLTLAERDADKMMALRQSMGTVLLESLNIRRVASYRKALFELLLPNGAHVDA